MYIGHLGLALAAKGRRPASSLPWLVVATQGCDWLDALLLPFMTWERAEIWTHSIPATLAGAAILALLAGVLLGDRFLGWTVALLYLSHPVLDYPTGLKPTWAGGPWIGLRLYSHPLADLLLEGLLLLVCWSVYRTSLPADSRRAGLAWTLLATLLGLQLACDIRLAVLHGPRWMF
ncbi:MAG: hypothetical protein ABJD11_11795 [Gemmatimonadota bacterium]